jgi:Protein of unknown function (DUF3833)
MTAPLGATTASGPPAPFDMTRFFEGQTRAYGLFENRKGEVRRRFTADITGKWDGAIFNLDEAFRYDDGRSEHRIWRIEKHDAHHFTARCDDVVGQAHGTASPDRSHMTYTFRLLLASGRRVALDVDDYMFPVHDDLLLNKATLRKWGIRVGQIFVTYERVGRATMAHPERSERILTRA